MSELEKLYRRALERIRDCKESDLARYCAKVDAIAFDALCEADALGPEKPKGPQTMWEAMCIGASRQHLPPLI